MHIPFKLSHTDAVLSFLLALWRACAIQFAAYFCFLPPPLALEVRVVARHVPSSQKEVSQIRIRIASCAKHIVQHTGVVSSPPRRELTPALLLQISGLLLGQPLSSRVGSHIKGSERHLNSASCLLYFLRLYRIRMAVFSAGQQKTSFEFCTTQATRNLAPSAKNVAI